MKKISVFVLIITTTLFSGGKLFAQPTEQLIPLLSNPIQMADAIRLASQRNAALFPLDTIVLSSTGLHDDFSYDSHRPDTSLWDLAFSNPATGVFVNRTWAIAPINLGVCTFDGIKWNGEPYSQLASVNSSGPCDELVSRPIDLTAYSVSDSVYLSFWYQAKGRGYAPNAQDSFLLDFNIPAWNDTITATTIWKNIWYTEGYTPASSDSNFRQVLIKLDSASYFTSGFRFRFRNYASQCGSNDHWHLDEVFLKNNRSINDTLTGDVGFVYAPSSALTNFWSIPHTHYKPSMMAPNFNVQIRNNDVASRNITYWYYVYDETNALLSPTPYPNVSGAVDICPTYLSSGYMNSASLTNPPIVYSYPQTAVNNDSTTFVMMHILKENATTFDTCVTTQKFYNYYAYDDGTAEVGYGLYGQYSQLAYKFTMPVGVTDTLKAIQMYFIPIQDIVNLQSREFTLKVWSDGGNQPGTVIYSQQHESPEYSFETPNRFVSYGIDSGLVILSSGQTYYIGWEQQAIDRLYIGFDFNDDHSDKIYVNTTGNWLTSIFDGSLMMRPVFGTVYPHSGDQSGISEQHENSTFSVYPNPANDQITISGLSNVEENCTVSIVDISGREVRKLVQFLPGSSIDVSALGPGIYFIQLKNDNGTFIGTQRFVISE